MFSVAFHRLEVFPQFFHSKYCYGPVKKVAGVSPLK